VTAKKILVVAPASLLNNWAAEFRKWLGSERVVSLSPGTARCAGNKAAKEKFCSV
jgi:hypothetical protein